MKKLGKQGFTLIEILVVMAILAVLAMLIVGAIILAREQARMTQATNFAHGVESSMKDSTLGHWSFNENSGSTTKDDWGNNNITVESPGKVGTWVQGMNGTSAYQFSGTGWVVSSLSNPVGPVKTIAFWFRLPNTTDLDGTFISTLDSSSVTEDAAGNFGTTSPQSYGNKFCPSSPTNIWSDSSFIVKDDSWHYYTMSKNVDTKICLDGNCKTFTTPDPASTIKTAYALDFNGAGGCGWGQFTQGIIIDDLALYSKAF